MFRGFREEVVLSRAEVCVVPRSEGRGTGILG